MESDPASLRYWSGLRTHQRGARQASFPLCAPLWRLTELSVSVIALGSIYHEGRLVGGNIFETFQATLFERIGLDFLSSVHSEKSTWAETIITKSELWSADPDAHPYALMQIVKNNLCNDFHRRNAA